ncbi:MAG TPA: nuclear transport factor 2 family protein [Acidimicrobiales bacterium]|nr:nuclear transport factor 2 family protein [Acidimicrobiales bacterium]
MGDIDEIEALVYGYGELIDTGDITGVVALFDDAVWRSSATGEALRDPAAVRAVYDRIVLYDDGTPRTKHVITNLKVDVAPDGRSATGSCYFTVLQGIVTGEPVQVVVAGRYDDRYERGPAGWRFAERVFTAQLEGDQSRHFLGHA